MASLVVYSVQHSSQHAMVVPKLVVSAVASDQPALEVGWQSSYSPAVLILALAQRWPPPEGIPHMHSVRMHCASHLIDVADYPFQTLLG